MESMPSCLQVEFMVTMCTDKHSTLRGPRNCPVRQMEFKTQFEYSKKKVGIESSKIFKKNKTKYENKSHIFQLSTMFCLFNIIDK